ncbi:MAG: phage tail tape measure protein [Planctomycetota bacterium]
MADPQPIKQKIETDYDGRGVQQATQSIEGMGSKVADASEELQQQAQRTQQLRTALTALIAAEDRYQREVQGTEAANDEAERAAEDRRVEIDRLGRELADVTEAERRHRRELDRVVNKHRQANAEIGRTRGLIGGLGRLWQSATSGIKGYVAGFIGFAAVTRLIQAQNQELQQNLQLMRDLANAQRDFLFLGGDETPREKDAILQGARVIGGKDAQEQLTRTFAQLKSQTSTLGTEDRIALFNELVQTSLTTETAPTDLVELFAKGRQFIDDPNRLQNVIAQTIIESPESDPSAIARLLPQTLPLGQAAGLSPEEVAGLTSFFAGRAGSPEVGVTALRSVILRLQAQGSDQQEQLKDQLGIDDEQSLLANLQALAQARRAGSLDLTALKGLVGEEPAAVLSSALDAPDQQAQIIGRIVEAGQSPRDITGERLARVLRENPAIANELRTRQLEFAVAEQQRAKADSRVQQARLLLEKQLLEEDVAPFIRRGLLKAFDTAVASGASAETALFTTNPFNVEDQRDEILQQLDSAPATSVAPPRSADPLPTPPPSSIPLPSGPPSAPGPVSAADPFENVGLGTGETAAFLPPEAAQQLAAAGIDEPANPTVIIIDNRQTLAGADNGVDAWEASRGITRFRRLT